MKIHVTPQTQFATPGGLKAGMHVSVSTADGHTATKVTAHQGKKGKKKK